MPRRKQPVISDELLDQDLRFPERVRLSEFPCLGPYDAAEGAIVCRDANSLRSRMSCWTSC